MKAEEAILLRGLFDDTAVSSLGVLVDELPYVGLLPFAVADEYGAAVIHASDLARHSKGLGDGAPFSLLIHGAGERGEDPLQVPRVMLHGSVEKITKGTPDYDGARDVYLAKFPSAGRTFMLGDFNLYRLAFAKGRFVVGFGRTVNLKRETLQGLAKEPASV